MSAPAHSSSGQHAASTSAVTADADRRRRVLEALIAQQAAKDRAAAEKAAKEAAERAKRPMYLRESARAAEREAKIAALKAEEARREMEGCTFAPSINDRSRQMAPTSRKHHLTSPTISRAAKLQGSVRKAEARSASDSPSLERGYEESDDAMRTPAVPPREGYAARAAAAIALAQAGPQEYDPEAGFAQYAADAHAFGDELEAAARSKARGAHGRRSSGAGQAPVPPSLSITDQLRAGWAPRPLMSPNTAVAVAHAAAAAVGHEFTHAPPPPSDPRPGDAHRSSASAAAPAHGGAADARGDSAPLIERAVARAMAALGLSSPPPAVPPSAETGAPAAAAAVRRASQASVVDGTTTAGRRSSQASLAAPPPLHPNGDRVDSGRRSPAPSESHRGPARSQDGRRNSASTQAVDEQRSSSRAAETSTKMRLLADAPDGTEVPASLATLAALAHMSAAGVSVETHERELEAQREALRDEHDAELARLHKVYEEELVALAMKPSVAQVTAYTSLSEKFMDLEQSRTDLVVSEASAKREVAMLREELKKSADARAAESQALHAALETMKADRAALEDKIAALTSELRRTTASFEERLAGDARAHATAMDSLKGEHERGMHMLSREHQRAMEALRDSKEREVRQAHVERDEAVAALRSSKETELSALHKAMEERMAALVREKDEALSTLAATKAVEIEAALAAAESQAAAAVIAAASAAGVSEMASPRRRGAKIVIPNLPASAVAAALSPRAHVSRGSSDGSYSTPRRGEQHADSASTEKLFSSANAAANAATNAASAANATMAAHGIVEGYAELLEALAAETAALREAATSASNELATTQETLAETTETLARTVEERDALQRERDTWVAQLETENNDLRRLHDDAREAKEKLIAEMTSLAEERAQLDADRSGMKSREAQLVSTLINLGIPVPPASSAASGGAYKQESRTSALPPQATTPAPTAPAAAATAPSAYTNGVGSAARRPSHAPPPLPSRASAYASPWSGSTGAPAPSASSTGGALPVDVVAYHQLQSIKAEARAHYLASLQQQQATGRR